MTVTGRAWSGRLAFGPWWLLYSGPIGPTDPHAHHAYQIVVNRGRIAVQLPGGGPAVGPIVVIDPDVTHEITGRRPHALVVYIDPDTDAGRRLSARRARAADVLDGVSNVVNAMHPDDWYQAEQIVGRVLGTILPGPGRDAPAQHAA